MSFQLGQRVLFEDGPDRVKGHTHMASLGLEGVVMHLNAKLQDGTTKPISGRVLKIEVDRDGSVTISFQPDGMLDDVSVQGFQMAAKYFHPYGEEEAEFPVTITNNLGEPVSYEQIAEAFEKRRVLREESRQAEELRMTDSPLPLPPPSLPQIGEHDLGEEQ